MRVTSLVDGLERELDPVVQSHSPLDLRGSALAERDGGGGDEGSLTLYHSVRDVARGGGEDDEGREGEVSGCDYGGVDQSRISRV